MTKSELPAKLQIRIMSVNGVRLLLKCVHNVCAVVDDFSTMHGWLPHRFSRKFEPPRLRLPQYIHVDRVTCLNHAAQHWTIRRVSNVSSISLVQNLGAFYAMVLYPLANQQKNIMEISIFTYGSVHACPRFPVCITSCTVEGMYTFCGRSFQNGTLRRRFKRYYLPQSQ